MRRVASVGSLIDRAYLHVNWTAKSFDKPKSYSYFIDCNILAHTQKQFLGRRAGRKIPRSVMGNCNFPVFDQNLDKFYHLGPRHFPAGARKNFFWGQLYPYRLRLMNIMSSYDTFRHSEPLRERAEVPLVLSFDIEQTPKGSGSDSKITTLINGLSRLSARFVVVCQSSYASSFYSYTLYKELQKVQERVSLRVNFHHPPSNTTWSYRISKCACNLPSKRMC